MRKIASRKPARSHWWRASVIRSCKNGRKLTGELSTDLAAFRIATAYSDESRRQKRPSQIDIPIKSPGNVYGFLPCAGLQYTVTQSLQNCAVSLQDHYFVFNQENRADAFASPLSRAFTHLHFLVDRRKVNTE